jgi:hypothetical protein
VRRRIGDDRLRSIVRLVPRRFRAAYLEQRPGAVVISVPKCGRTWLRLLLLRALANEHGVDIPGDLSFRTLRNEVPSLPPIDMTHDDEPMYKRPEDIEWSKHAYRQKSVVLLVRDPRDAIVSLFHHATRRPDKQHVEIPLPATADEMVSWPYGGLPSMVTFMNHWASQTDVPRDRLHLLRYEELRADAEGQLLAVLRFLDLHVSPANVHEAITYCEFSHMRELEASRAFSNEILHARDPDDPDSFKVRRGVVGGYRDELSPQAIEEMDRYIETHLDPVYRYGGRDGRP